MVLNRASFPWIRWIGTRGHTWKTFIPAARICFGNIGTAVRNTFVWIARMPPEPLAPCATIAQAAHLATQFGNNRQRDDSRLHLDRIKILDAESVNGECHSRSSTYRTENCTRVNFSGICVSSTSCFVQHQAG